MTTATLQVIADTRKFQAEFSKIPGYTDATAAKAGERMAVRIAAASAKAADETVKKQQQAADRYWEVWRKAIAKEAAEHEKAQRQIQESAASTESAWSRMAGTLSALGVYDLLKQAATAALDLAKSSVEAADAIADLSEDTRISMETLDGLRLAATLAGEDFDEFAGIFGRLQKMIVEFAETGGGKAALVFEELDVSVRNFDGSTRSADEVLREVLDKLSTMTDRSKALGLAQKFAGDEGAKLMRVLNGHTLDQFTLAADNAGVSVRRLTDEADRSERIAAAWALAWQKAGNSIADDWVSAQESILQASAWVSAFVQNPTDWNKAEQVARQRSSEIRRMLEGDIRNAELEAARMRESWRQGDVLITDESRDAARPFFERFPAPSADERKKMAAEAQKSARASQKAARDAEADRARMAREAEKEATAEQARQDEALKRWQEREDAIAAVGQANVDAVLAEIDAEIEAAQVRTQIHDERMRQIEEERVAAIQSVQEQLDYAQQFVGAIGNLMDAVTSASVERAAADVARTKRVVDNQIMLHGEATQAQIDAWRDAEREQKRVLLEQFKARKAIAIVEAAISAAQSVLSALELPPPASFIAAAAAGIAAATQVATIASAQPNIHHTGRYAVQSTAPDESYARLRRGEVVVDAVRVNRAGGGEAVRNMLDNWTGGGPPQVMVRIGNREIRAIAEEIHNMGTRTRGMSAWSP